jgi:hypothetical protein
MSSERDVTLFASLSLVGGVGVGGAGVEAATGGASVALDLASLDVTGASAGQ